MKKNLLIVFVSLGLLACGEATDYQETNASAASAANDTEEQTTVQATAKDVSADEFTRLMEQDDVQILDVRTLPEVSEGIIPGAIHYDIYEGDFETNLATLDKAKPVLVYCAAGGRSGKAMNMMTDMGFTEVYNLSGGMRKWAKEGRTVVEYE